MHWTEHGYRRLIDAETHARPVLPMAAPCRVRRLAFMSAQGTGDDLRALHGRMLQIAGISADGPAWARQLTFARDGRTVTWELHNEFATLTWSAPIDDGESAPEGIGLELHAGLPVISATRIDLTAGDRIAEPALSGFSPLSLSYSTIFDGQAEAATDFHLDADRFVRVEVAAGRCGNLRRGVIVRRLLEIETYRSMALLGLPLARDLGGRVADYEYRLTQIVRTIGLSQSAAEHQETLAGLHALSSEVGRTVEETSFRFAATQAYADLLDNRLGRLREAAIGEFTTIERFISNRAHPAIATCRAMEKRLGALTDKVQRSIELLDARISLAIQVQNQSVLDGLSATARSQFRLQQTVEGLSIIAISYYALGLLGYLYEGFHALLPAPKGTMLALSAPLVLLLVFLGIRRIRQGTHHD
ncbi:MAG: DUF3422 domain-containing protein [Devosia sp.]|nr:DUF3422 domain-containing protein [Devosia sp.]